MKELPLTAVPIWSPSALPVPLLATGTVSGALDDSFSSDSLLELWDPFSDNDTVESLGKVSVSSRFNRLAWGGVSDSAGTGVIAGGLENGEIWLWNPEGIILGESEDGDEEEKVECVVSLPSELRLGGATKATDVEC
jgi:protein transport protein SEC31